LCKSREAAEKVYTDEAKEEELFQFSIVWVQFTHYCLFLRLMKARKKWLIAASILLILSIVCIYIFIPGKLEVSRLVLVKCNSAGASRVLYPRSDWETWWPSAVRYPIPGAVINIFPLRGVDSSILQCNLDIITSFNPLTVLAALRGFLEKTANIYGMEVSNGMSRDSALMVTEFETPAYPTTTEVYQAIADLRGYIISRGGKETNYPMLRVIKGGDGKFNSMVAVPLDKRLKEDGKLYPRAFVPWKVLTGEVRGGPAVAERAMDQLQLFVMDHQKTAMAVPFQSLVTERDKEPDTSRWITRVIVPVP
jgi:hypothetical protein